MFQNIFIFCYKAFRKVKNIISTLLSKLVCYFLFFGQGVQFKNFKTQGVPFISVASGGVISLGRNFRMNNTLRSNPIGRTQKCIFFIDKNAKLIIGNNVGISQTAIVCHQQIKIGNNVKIGGGVCIYDTDFHSLNPSTRKDPKKDIKNKVNKPVEIKNNAFIGAHSTILKGVIIGENSIVGASSVVTKNIPDNEIWAGNPARFIKKIIY